MKLEGKTALISGALGDIGLAVSKELASQGANVAMSDILAPDKAAKAIADIEAMGRRCAYELVDIADPDQVKAWVGKIERELGVPDLVVPNAAIVSSESCRELSVVEWRKHIDINLSGAFYMAQAAANTLVEAKRPGRIVFIGSWAAERVHPLIPAYCVAKAGLRMLCQSMAAEYARDDILINELAPGYVNAGLSGKIFDENPDYRERSVKRVPIRRLIEVEEVAKQVAYLCDPENRHMTGSTLTMEGGLSLFGAPREDLGEQ